jgi:predicted metalloprotease with PDZ domain
MAPAEAASGFDKDNHWGLVYGGGLFSGICLDLEIRHNSNNTKSLDDVMRALYIEFGGSENTIDQERLIQITSEFGRTNFAAFFEKHIMGPELVPLERYTPYAGMEVNYENNQLSIQRSKENSEKEKEIWMGFLGNN